MLTLLQFSDLRNYFNFFLIRSSDVALEISSYLTLTDAEQLQLEPEFYYSVITDVFKTSSHLLFSIAWVEVPLRAFGFFPPVSGCARPMRAFR